MRARDGKNVYTYHNARNKIQLIGAIAKDPVQHEVEKGRIIRIVIEISERDDNYKFFSSFHVVIIPADRLVPHIELNLKKGDAILVQGRLSNYKDKKTGNVISNVQASEVMVLSRAPEPEKTPEEKAEEEERIRRGKEKINDPEFWDAFVKGKIVPLSAAKKEPEIDEGDEHGEVDDNGRVEDKYATWRAWKRQGGDLIPF